MRFSCQADTLLSGLNISTHVLSPRTTQPILEGVLLRTTEKGLQITCSDGSMSAVTTVDAVIEAEGDVVLPGRLFLDIVRKMPQDILTVTVNENHSATLRSIGVRMTLAGQSGKLFPAIPIVSAENAVSLPQGVLKEMFSQTSFAIAVDDPRKVLNGALFEIEHGEARVVALDGYRLALRLCRVGEDAPQVSAIVPGKTVSEIVKILEDDAEKSATILIGGAQMMVDFGATQFYSTLIEGEYINYRQILPSEFRTRVRFDKEQLGRCVERAALIARAGKNNILRIDIEEGRLIITSNAENGDAYDELAVEMTGDPLTIAFNVLYVSDILRALPEGEAELCLNSPVSPCLVNPIEGDDYLYLMLPVRVTA